MKNEGDYFTSIGSIRNLVTEPITKDRCTHSVGNGYHYVYIKQIKEAIHTKVIHHKKQGKYKACDHRSEYFSL